MRIERYAPSFRLFFLLVLSLALSVAAPLRAEPKPELNPSERALLEVLRKTPQYSYAFKLETLLLAQSTHHLIGSELTPESFEKLAAHLPELRERVEAGKNYRVAFYNEMARQGEKTLFEDRAIERNATGRALRTYYELLRVYNQKKMREATEQKVKPQARQTIANRHGYALTTSESSWDLEHQRELQHEIDRLRRSTEEQIAGEALPENIFKEWLIVERSRAAKEHGKVDAVVNNPTSYNAGKRPDLRYTELLGRALDRELNKLSRELKNASAEDQAALIAKLEEVEIAAEGDKSAVRRQLFGDPEEARNGALTSVVSPDRGWLQDVVWWGYSDEVEPLKGERGSRPNWEHWANRALNSYLRFGFLPWPGNPTIQRVADPEGYAAKVRALWEARKESALKWTKNTAATVAIVGGAIAGTWGLWKGLEYGVKAGLESPPPGYSAQSNLDTSELGRLSRPSEHAPDIHGFDTVTPPEPVAPKTRPEPFAGMDRGRGMEPTEQWGMSREEQRSRNDSGGTHGEEKPLFRITRNLRGLLSSIPSEFQFASRGDRGEAQFQSQTPRSQALFSIETAVPLRADGQLVSLLAAPGYDLSVEVFAEGRKLTAAKGLIPHNGEYALYYNARMGTYYLELPYSMNNSLVTWRAHFHPDARRAPQTAKSSALPQVSYSDAAWLLALQRDKGFTAQAEMLEKELGDAMAAERPIDPQKIVDIIEASSLYSSKKAEEAPNRDSMNPLDKYEPYRHGGKTEFECDGARNMARDELAVVWRGVEGVHLSDRHLLTRSGDAMEIYPSNGHARLAAYTDSFGPDQAVIFDPTPTQKAPTSEAPPPEVVTKKATPAHQAKLAQLSVPSIPPVVAKVETPQAATMPETPAKVEPEKLPIPKTPAEPKGPAQHETNSLVAWDIPRRLRPSRRDSQMVIRNYLQLPPGPPPPVTTAPEVPASSPVEPASEEAVANPDPPAATARRALPPPRVEAPIEIDEARLRADAQRELARRRQRNEQRRQQLQATQIASARLAQFAQAVQLSPHDPVDPHNRARRLELAIRDYIEGKHGSLEALKAALGELGVAVPQELTSEAELKQFLTRVTDRFEKSRAYSAELEKKAAQRKREYTRGAYSDEAVKKAMALVNMLKANDLTPVESENLALITAELRAQRVAEARQQRDRNRDTLSVQSCEEAVSRTAL